MRYAIVGAGISGLSVARMLMAEGHEVQVYEADDRPGGLEKCDRVNGHLFHMTGGHVFNTKRTDALMPRFCQYCGAFAATRLFVEIAIPTTLVPLADKISTTKSLNLRRLLLWDNDRDDFIEKYHADLDELCEHYPEDLLFVYPIKLSQWH